MTTPGIDYPDYDRTKSPFADVTQKITLMSCYRGSKAYNLYIPKEENEEFGTDDLDTIEVFTYPKSYYLSLYSYNHILETFEAKEDPLDIVGYELKKMVSMLIKMNPNVVYTLWTRKEDYLMMTEAWKRIIESRDLFINKKYLLDTTIGFATSQKNRMIGGAYKGYMGEKRKLLVDKFGYDTKNAVHTLRILRTGKEFLLNGYPNIYRESDRQELIDIKMGKYRLGDVLEMIDKEFRLTQQAFEDSKLSDKINNRKINELLYDIMKGLPET